MTLSWVLKQRKSYGFNFPRVKLLGLVREWQSDECWGVEWYPASQCHLDSKQCLVPNFWLSALSSMKEGWLGCQFLLRLTRTQLMLAFYFQCCQPPGCREYHALKQPRWKPCGFKPSQESKELRLFCVEETGTWRMCNSPFRAADLRSSLLTQYWNGAATWDVWSICFSGVSMTTNHRGELD